MMLLQIAIIGLAAIAALNLVWLFSFQWPLSGQPTRAPTTAPQPSLSLPAMLSSDTQDVADGDKPETPALVVVEPVVRPAARPRGARAAVSARIVWLRAGWEEELAALMTIGGAMLCARTFTRHSS